MLPFFECLSCSNFLQFHRYIGTDVALAFLRAGWRVKGAVRSKEKADAWIALYPQYMDQCEYTIVEDIAVNGAFDEAVKGCDAIAHVASPYTFSFKVSTSMISSLHQRGARKILIEFCIGIAAKQDNEKDMLLPAINGMKNILEATKLEPRIKRFVFTSSFAAVNDPLTLPAIGKTFTADDWNPTTYEDAKQSPIPGTCLTVRSLRSYL